MAKTKEQIHKYNQEYSSRPAVREWAKIRNARPERRAVRNAYKKSKRGKEINEKSRRKNWDKKAPLREKQLLWRYGLTPYSFQSLLDSQSGKCAICSVIPKSRLHIDHNHETGRVRGLLCGNCNMGLGLFKDSKELLNLAKLYLEKYEG